MFAPMPPHPPTPDQLSRYLRHLADDRHLAASTVAGYREELALVIHREVLLEPEALAAFVSRTVDGRPLAPNTRNRRLAIVRGFCRFLVRRGELASDPTAAIARARVPRDLSAALTVEDLRRVMAVLREALFSWRRTRDEAILSLLFYSGLRVSELVALDVAQVDVGRGILLQAVRKGGGKTDVVLADRARSVLASWLPVRPGEASGPVFLSSPGRRLSVRQIQKRLQRLGVQAGLGDRLHPHALRHAHATALLRVGVDVEIVRRSMNHATLTTTARYLHSDETLLRESLERLPEL